MNRYRYTLTVPVLDNDAHSLAHVHEHIRTHLLAKFGGYTSVDGMGGWLSPDGKPYAEAVRVYTVDTVLYSEEAIRYLALRVRRMAKQDAIYVTFDRIEVDLI